MTFSARALYGSLAAALVMVIGGCTKTDTAKPIASASFSASKPRVALGSPVVLNYRFDVAPDATISGDYKVFVHVSDSDGKGMWDDDHESADPDIDLEARSDHSYSRTKFIPVFPYLGEATVKVGLHKGIEQLPLSGIDPADRTSTNREYKVGTLELVPQSENVFIQYRGGWHPDEYSPETPSISWHWTQKLATLSFANPKKDATFYLEYDARPDVFNGQPQNVTVYLGDQALTTFPAGTTALALRLIPVTAAQFGTSEMAEVRIEVDKTFVPARLPNGGKDARELGIRVYHAFVEVK